MDALPSDINYIDAAVLTVMGLSTLVAVWRGFMREALALIAWIAAFFVAIRYYDDLRDFLLRQFGDPLLAAAGSGGLLFFGTLIMVTLIGSLIIKRVRGEHLLWIDRLLGMVAGVVRGGFMVALAYVMTTAVIPPHNLPVMFHNARTKPFILSSAELLTTLVPEYAVRLQQQMTDTVEEAKKHQPELEQSIPSRSQLEENLDRLRGKSSPSGQTRKEIEKIY